MQNKIVITDTIVYLAKNMQPGSKLLGFARIVLNNEFVLGGLRLYQGKEGAFIKYPEGTPIDLSFCYPITAEFRERVAQKIIGQYEIEIELLKSKEGLKNSVVKAWNNIESFGEIVEELRFKKGFDYEQTCNLFVSLIPNITANDFEDKMYQLDSEGGENV